MSAGEGTVSALSLVAAVRVSRQWVWIHCIPKCSNFWSSNFNYIFWYWAKQNLIFGWWTFLSFWMAWIFLVSRKAIKDWPDSVFSDVSSCWLSSLCTLLLFTYKTFTISYNKSICVYPCILLSEIYLWPIWKMSFMYILRLNSAFCIVLMKRSNYIYIGLLLKS